MKHKLPFFAAILIAFLLGGCAAGYNVSEPSLVSGGLKIKSLLYQPSKMEHGRRYPGVVVNHGGTDGVEFATRSWARELARNGFVVVLPQFRGQGGSDGHVEFSGGEVDDTLAAFEYLKGLGYVEADRIGMIGYSLGGLVTLNALEREPGIKAAVLLSAISDPVAFFEEAAKDKPSRSRSPFQTERHRRDMEVRSPLNGLEKIDAPILIIHGALDRKVSPEQSKRLYGRLKALGKDVNIVVYPYINHEIVWFDRPMSKTVEFLKMHLNEMSRSN